MDYWQGEHLKLRALEAKDFELFQQLDHEFDKNIDAIYFPQTKDRMRSWIDKEMQPRIGDAFR